ncbi:MAG: glutamate-5-semialdehyde dehydrogenase [Clostridia bacterium]|nr:glutamate-5-semialdehyde dehydrogenase [Clostridia bacterium]
MSNLDVVFDGAKKASFQLSSASENEKNNILSKVAKTIGEDMKKILDANAEDINNARANGMSESMIDRLSLSESKINAIINAIGKVIALPDPIGKAETNIRPNGLEIRKVSVPLGVVGIIYESRPNVTVDAACLCLKSGNVCVLRGGKEAINSNLAFCDSIRRALKECGFDENCVNVLSDTSRDSAKALMTANGKIDVLIPRGGKGLIQSVVENATVPVIETGAGNCHVYVDESANLDMANEIAFNARAQRPSVCNSAENLLVHEKIAEKFLPMMQERMKEKNVELRGCEKTLKILPDITAATEEDFYTEYNDYILSVKVVKDVFEAVTHINEHSTKHSEAIVTENKANADYFTTKIDSAAVYVNASTRFTDGEEFGLGAEIGISTQKMHARGPMGLEALTTTKYVVLGTGQTRT